LLRVELSNMVIRRAKHHWYLIKYQRVLPHSLPGMTNEMMEFFQNQGWDIQRTMSKVSDNYWFNSYTIPNNQLSFFLLRYGS
jgi:hypothetical protein